MGVRKTVAGGDSNIQTLSHDMLMKIQFLSHAPHPHSNHNHTIIFTKSSIKGRGGPMPTAVHRFLEEGPFSYHIAG